MLITKKIQIEFADPRMRAIDAIQDLRKATKSASLNLYSRYDVQLQWPMPYAGDKVILEIGIPEEIVATFAIGNHLRGLSTYLLKQCGGRYDQFLVGKRLLNYIEVPSLPNESPDFQTVDRLEAIVDFAKLLERSDEQAMDQISRILVILKEAQNDT